MRRTSRGPHRGARNGPVLDSLDYGIVRSLQQDGRASYSAPAKHLGVTEGTIRNRLARLLAARVLRIVAVADLFKVGLQAAAITGINVERSKIKQALARLMKMGEVRYIAVTTGRLTSSSRSCCRIPIRRWC